MDNYTVWEYGNVRLITGEASDSSAAAVRLYAERYPQRRFPNPPKFQATDRASGEPGTVPPLR
jgi:hypothetical protein